MEGDGWIRMWVEQEKMEGGREEKQSLEGENATFSAACCRKAATG